MQSIEMVIYDPNCIQTVRLATVFGYGVCLRPHVYLLSEGTQLIMEISLRQAFLLLLCGGSLLKAESSRSGLFML